MTTKPLLFRSDVYAYWRARQASAMDALAEAYGPPMLPTVRDLIFMAEVGDEAARAKLRPLLRRRWLALANRKAAERLTAQEAAR